MRGQGDRDTITVYWYDCRCEWLSKYCDEEHRRVAVIPRGVIEQHTRDNVKQGSS